MNYSKEHLTNYRNKIVYKYKKTVQDNNNSNKDKKNDNAAKYSNENKSSTGANKDIALVNKRTSESLVPSTSSSVAKNETVENSNKTVQLVPILYFCEVCQVKFPNTEKNIGIHNTGMSHMKKLRETKAVNNTKVEPIHSYEYFCEVCQVKVPNTEKNIAIHNKGRPHMKNLQDTKAGNNTEVEAISNKKSILHYQMKETATLNIVTCIVCNTFLTNNDRNICTHIEGESHKSIYNDFCARNLLVPRGNLLYCNACEVIPGLRNEFAHCNGRNHKFNLEEVVSN